MPRACLLVLGVAAIAGACRTLGPAPRPPTLIVLNKNDASASLFDPATGAERTRVPVGIGPHEVAVTPDGRTAVVCNYGDQRPGNTLTVFDVDAPDATRRTIDLGNLLRPHGIAFLPDGRRFVVTAETARKVGVVDLESGVVEATLDTKQHGSHMLALDAGGDRVYVSNIMSNSVSILDVALGSLVDVVDSGKQAEGLAVRPGHDEVWIGNRAENTISVLDASSLSIDKIDCGAFPIRVEFTPDARHALVTCANANTLEVFDATTRSRVAIVDLAPADDPRPVVPVGIEVSPDGREVFVAGAGNDSVSVVDTQSWSVVRCFSTGPTPDGMAWAAGTP